MNRRILNNGETKIVSAFSESASTGLSENLSPSFQDEEVDRIMVIDDAERAFPVPGSGQFDPLADKGHPRFY